MPTKRPRQCAIAGCPGIVPIGEVYCDVHQKVNFKRYEQTRDKSIKRKYSTKAWANFRLMKLARNPLCEACLAETGRPVAATTVHHKNPVMEGGAFLPTFDETESVCNHHHAVRHPKGAIRKQLHAK